VNGTDEHHAQANPDEARQPAEGLTRQDGSGNGSGRGNGREMLGKQIEGTCGNVIHAVFLSHRGRWTAVVDLEPARHPSTVKAVGGADEQKKANGQ